MALPKSLTHNPKNGRITASGILTDQQLEFVRHFSAGIKAVESARLAGYAQPDQEAWRLRQLPHVRQAILEEQMRAIQTNGSQLAWETMQNLMKDKQTPKQVQFQAARWTLEAAGQGLAARAQKAGMQTPGGKALHEMTSGELERFIAEGREALAQSQAVEVAVEIVEAVERETMAGNGQETLEM